MAAQEGSLASSLLRRNTSTKVQNTNPLSNTMAASMSKSFVKHNYHDHAGDSPTPMDRLKISTFLKRLHELLDDAEGEGIDHIINWQPHGRCFVLRDPKALPDILSRYFKISKVSSFQRQLNLYGFLRLTKGMDRGGYYHEFFLKGKPFLASQITRIKIKGTKVRQRANPDDEPDFWSMPWVSDYSSINSTQASEDPLQLLQTPSLAVPVKTSEITSQSSSTGVASCNHNETSRSYLQDLASCIVKPSNAVVRDCDMSMFPGSGFQSQHSGLSTAATLVQGEERNPRAQGGTNDALSRILSSLNVPRISEETGLPGDPLLNNFQVPGSQAFSWAV